MKKNDLWNLFFLTILVLAIVLFCIFPGNMYGSVTDWGSQHTMFPEYFRMLFYQTGELFPDFMLHLGAGQNIYNISYYGLLNPIVLLSYFFPFIKMVDFLMVMNVILILSSIYLFYYWLSKKGFSRTIVMVSAIIFATSAPLIFHSHRHIMFVTYMPFLLLGLIGIDNYFEKEKRSLLAISTFLMIMTSYYYSIGGILVFVIYGIYCYLKKEKNITIKKFIFDGFRFLYPIILGILLSAILLLPTIYVIKTGRSDGGGVTKLSELLLPHLDINALVYSSYSIGLSAIAIFALFHTFFKKKKEFIFIGTALVLLLSIPLFMYLLNGLLYVRAKVLIPFLPLFVLLISEFLKDLEEKKCDLKPEIVILTLLSFFWYWRGYHQIWFFIDLAFCMLFLCAYQKWNKKWLYFIPITIFVIVSSFVTNHGEKFETKKNYQNSFHHDKVSLIESTLKKDNQFYRFQDLTDTLLTVNKVYQDHYYTTSLYSSTFNQPYKDFYYGEMGNADTYRNRLVTSSASNIFFETLMNVKYVVAKVGEQPVGYQLIEQKGNYGLYQNDNVYPLGYVTDKIYNQKFYEQLEFPYNMEVLMDGVVVENKGLESSTSHLKKIDLLLPQQIENFKTIQTEKGYKVEVKKDTTFDFPLSTPIKKNEILILKFRIDKSQNCKLGDLSITINNLTNKLTCKQWIYHNGNFDFEYIISGDRDIDHLSIKMSKGTYEIVGIENYVLDYSTFQNNSKSVDSFVVDTKKTKGNQIKGNIEVTKDGYFVLSIPYDKAFGIKVDGKKQKIEKVNQTFIGFPMSKGTHEIEIIYEAPLKKAGLGISLLSFCLFLFMVYQDKKK